MTGRDIVSLVDLHHEQGEVGMRLLKFFAAAGLLAALAVSQARANTIEVNWAGQSGNVFQYQVKLTATAKLTSGNYIVIYDFAGPVSVDLTDLSQPGFVYLGTASTGSGTMSPYVAPPAGFTDTALPNLIIKYTGSTYTPGADQILGLIKVTSLYTNLGPDGAVTTADSGGTDPFRAGQFYSAFLPTAAVPVPAAAWSGLGLLGMLGVARVRKAMK